MTHQADITEFDVWGDQYTLTPIFSSTEARDYFRHVFHEKYDETSKFLKDTDLYGFLSKSFSKPVEIESVNYNIYEITLMLFQDAFIKSFDFSLDDFKIQITNNILKKFIHPIDILSHYSDFSLTDLDDSDLFKRVLTQFVETFSSLEINEKMNVINEISLYLVSLTKINSFKVLIEKVVIGLVLIEILKACYNGIITKETSISLINYYKRTYNAFVTNTSIYNNLIFLKSAIQEILVIYNAEVYPFLSYLDGTSEGLTKFAETLSSSLDGDIMKNYLLCLIEES